MAPLLWRAVNVAAPVLIIIAVLVIGGIYFAGRIFGRGVKDSDR